LRGVGDGGLAGSEYLRQVHGVVAGRPSIDLAAEGRLQQALIAAAEAGLLRSAHDCSHGGLAVTLAECCLPNGLGLEADLRFEGRLDAALFGEETSRVVVSVREDSAHELEALGKENGVACLRLGNVGGERLRLSDFLDVELALLKSSYDWGLEWCLNL